jgi:hypothetical protein
LLNIIQGLLDSHDRSENAHDVQIGSIPLEYGDGRFSSRVSDFCQWTTVRPAQMKSLSGGEREVNVGIHSPD